MAESVEKIKEKFRDAKGFFFSKLGGVGIPIFKPYENKSGIGKFIPFSGDGIAIKTANNFPDVLAKLAADSPTHGAAIRVKSRLTLGQGFNTEAFPEKVKTLFREMEDSGGDSANELLEKLAADLALYSGFSFRVNWGGGKNIAAIEHVPFKWARIGELTEGKVTFYPVSNDFDLKNPLHQSARIEYSLNKFNPESISESKKDKDTGDYVADDTTRDNAWQMVYCTLYSAAGNGLYPVPEYSGCLDAALTEVETGIAMRNGIENGINGGVIITTKDDTPLDDDSKNEVITTLNRVATGAQNASSLIFMPANVNITKLDAVEADVYKEVNTETKQRIITGHDTPAILLEVNLSGGGFNNRAEEMKAAVQQFQGTTILGYQQKIVRSLEKVLRYVSSEEGYLEILPFLEAEKEEAEKDEVIENEPTK
jgi:hypothetical protein